MADSPTAFLSWLIKSGYHTLVAAPNSTAFTAPLRIPMTLASDSEKEEPLIPEKNDR